MMRMMSHSGNVQLAATLIGLDATGGGESFCEACLMMITSLHLLGILERAEPPPPLRLHGIL